MYTSAIQLALMQSSLSYLKKMNNNMFKEFTVV